MDSVQILNQLVETHKIWAYVVIFLGLIFEGEVVLIATGVLAHLGALSFSTSLIFIIAGAFVKTFFGYYIGTVLYKKYDDAYVLRYMRKRILYFMPRFEEKPFWCIFVSKFIIGTNVFVLIFSGYNKVNIKTYLKADILSTLIWAPGLLCIGYFFSQAALSFSQEIWKFSLVIVSLILGFLLFDKLAATFFTVFEYMKNGFKKQ